MDESVEKAICKGGEKYLRAAKNVYQELEDKKIAEEANRQFRQYMYGSVQLAIVKTIFHRDELPYMDKKCRELFK